MGDMDKKPEQEGQLNHHTNKVVVTSLIVFSTTEFNYGRAVLTLYNTKLKNKSNIGPIPSLFFI